MLLEKITKCEMENNLYFEEDSSDDGEKDEEEIAKLSRSDLQDIVLEKHNVSMEETP